MKREMRRMQNSSSEAKQPNAYAKRRGSRSQAGWVLQRAGNRPADAGSGVRVSTDAQLELLAQE